MKEHAPDQIIVGGEGIRIPQSPETVVKDVFAHEFRRGIAFDNRADANKALRKLPKGYGHKIIVDHSQNPPLEVLMPSFPRANEDEDMAKSLGKERGYDYSYIDITINLDPSTKNLHVDFSRIISTLKKAGVSTDVSGEELVSHFNNVVKHRASIYEMEDEDKKNEAWGAFKKGKRTAILLAKQNGLDVYLELSREIEDRLLNFKSGDNLDISGTTLSIPPLSNHVQASNEARRIEFGLIYPAIDIQVVPSSKEGKIDDSLPNFDPKVLAAGRDLTARITTAFERLKPNT